MGRKSTIFAEWFDTKILKLVGGAINYDKTTVESVHVRISTFIAISFKIL